MPIYRIPLQATWNEIVHVEARDLHHARAKIFSGETLAEQFESCVDIAMFEDEAEIVPREAAPAPSPEYRSALLRENELHRKIQELARALRPFAKLIEEPGQFEDGEKLHLAIDPADVKKARAALARSG